MTTTIPTFPAPGNIFGAERPEKRVDAFRLYRYASVVTLLDGSVVRPSMACCRAAVAAYDAGLGGFPIVVTTDNYRSV